MSSEHMIHMIHMIHIDSIDFFSDAIRIHQIKKIDFWKLRRHR
jgi:hypothetical protein